MIFNFAGMALEYLKHNYNDADKNMRTVEVPIIIALMKRHKDVAHFLEIGNVLSHYIPVDHLVLDKYERIAQRSREIRIRQDLMEFNSVNNFDLIVSISTIEHIGFGNYLEIGDRKWTPFEIVSKIRSLLTDVGVAYVTVPIGYNPRIDRWLLEGHIGANMTGCMHRISDDNQWESCRLSQAFATDTLRPAGYPWSTGMVVLRINK